MNGAFTDTSFFTGAATPIPNNISLTCFNAAWAAWVGNQIQLMDKTRLIMPVPVHQNVMNSPNFITAMSSGSQVAGDVAAAGELGRRAGIGLDFDPDLDTVLGGGGYLSIMMHEYSTVLVSYPTDTRPDNPLRRDGLRGRAGPPVQDHPAVLPTHSF